MNPKLRWLGTLLVVGGCLAVTLPSVADSKKEEPPKKVLNPEAAQKEAQEADATIERLALAFKLREYGLKNHAPEALVTAAGMLRQIPPAVPRTEEPTLEVDADGTKGDPGLKVEKPKAFK